MLLVRRLRTCSPPGSWRCTRRSSTATPCSLLSRSGKSWTGCAQWHLSFCRWLSPPTASSVGAVRVQEWLTSEYRERLLLEGDRDDGEKLEDLTTAFRGEFRSTLLGASCKGLADRLLAAGMPFAVKNGNSARGVGARARSAQPSRGSLFRPRSSSPEEGLELAGDPST